jgi:hypothetical protein
VSALATRVARLEAATGEGGPCPVCRGERWRLPPRVVRVHPDGTAVVTHDAPPCPGCGATLTINVRRDRGGVRR